MRLLVFAGLAACSYSPVRSSGDPPIDTVDPVEDATSDTTPIDAAFDPATQCPSSYDIVIGGLASRYRAIPTNTDWPVHHAACANDLPGRTHLIVYDDVTELDLLAAAPIAVFQVGYFQRNGEPQLGSGWFTLTGEVVDPALWNTNLSQPNDSDGIESGRQQRAFIDYGEGARVQDSEDFHPVAGLCECDGKPIPSEIAAML